MDKLTTLEKALLNEFENLAQEFETLASASANTDQQLVTLSDHYSREISALAARQNALEERLTKVTEALNKQTASTNELINSVHRLIEIRASLSGL